MRAVASRCVFNVFIIDNNKKKPPPEKAVRKAKL